ncbi:MAG: ribose 5-phosphate isomerase A [Methanobacteriota archaeon]
MDAKEAAGERAASLVRGGMVVGLGTGRTADCATRALARRVAEEKLEFVGIPTSTATVKLAMSLGIKLASLDDHVSVDMTIDGADEVSPSKDLIKGLGGALLIEKVVASATKSYVIVADEGKMVGVLGRKGPVPVEILRFGTRQCLDRLSSLGCVPTIRARQDGSPFVTDCGNLIADCKFPEIAEPAKMDERLHGIVGVVETGLFVGMKPKVIVGAESGTREL